MDIKTFMRYIIMYKKYLSYCIKNMHLHTNTFPSNESLVLYFCNLNDNKLKYLVL